jgi:hypothetical protein
MTLSLTKKEKWLNGWWVIWDVAGQKLLEDLGIAVTMLSKIGGMEAWIDGSATVPNVNLASRTWARGLNQFRRQGHHNNPTYSLLILNTISIYNKVMPSGQIFIKPGEIHQL